MPPDSEMILTDSKSRPMYGGGLSKEERSRVFDWANNCTPEQRAAVVASLQTAAYVAAGGGWLGNTASRQPCAYYRDARAGKGPYKNKDVLKIVETLCLYALVAGLNPDDLPAVPLPNCFVW